MKVIKNLNELEKYRDVISNIKKTNYQQTYENIYSIHLSNRTAITFVLNDFVSTFIQRNENIYECALNIEPILSNCSKKEKYLKFIENIKKYLNKTIYFPLVYEDSKFYKLLSGELYSYKRLYTSICNYNIIGNNIIDKILKSKRVFYSNRNVKQFEKKLYVKYMSKCNIRDILIEIENESWKSSKKQDMVTKREQLIYYSELVKLGIASIAVAYTKEDNSLVAYRIDAIYNNKIHVLKNSYKEKYKKFSPGSYLLLYDLFKRYPNTTYLDLYGGPGLTKEMIETNRVNRFDMLSGDKEIISELQSQRLKWDKKNYDNYLDGNSIKKIFEKKQNILAVTSCFGLGPVGKLNAIVSASKQEFNWYASGEEFDMNIFEKDIFKDTCFTMDKEILRNFLDKYNIKYALVVLKNKMARLLLEQGVKVIYVDSLPFMWTEEDAKTGKVPYEVNCYCAQKTLELNDKSKEIFSNVKNLIWVDPIVNINITNSSLISVPYKNFVLINIGGLHSPNTDGNNYVMVVLKSLLDVLDKKDIIITTSTNAKNKVTEMLKKYSNVTVKTLVQEEFIEYIKMSDLFITSPGLTTILESSLIKDKVIFLPPQNISQFYNIEYGKKVFKYYKEITWNKSELTLNGLGKNIEKGEHDVIEEINRRISKLTSKTEMERYREYIETVIKQTYIKNNLTKINRYNGVQQVINNIKRIMEE